MSLHNLDDHYNQDRYRYERDGGISYMPMSKSFAFNRESAPVFWFNTQAGHRSKWFGQCNLMIGGLIIYFTEQGYLL